MRNYKILNRPMFNPNVSAYGRGIASNLVSEEERQRFNYGGRVEHGMGHLYWKHQEEELLIYSWRDTLSDKIRWEL